MGVQIERHEEDLPLLAIRAATALDAIKRGKSSDAEQFTRFMEALKSHKGSPAVQLKRLAPADTRVMARAVSAYAGKEVDSIDELKRELQQLFTQANKARLEGAIVTQLMQFCIAFHKELLDQNRMFVTSRRSRSPFRM